MTPMLFSTHTYNAEKILIVINMLLTCLRLVFISAWYKKKNINLFNTMLSNPNFVYEFVTYVKTILFYFPSLSNNYKEIITGSANVTQNL
jgi:hypothetical protein